MTPLWYARRADADLWHRTPAPRAPALCGAAPRYAWPDMQLEPPPRLCCQWCARAERKAALKGAPA